MCINTWQRCKFDKQGTVTECLRWCVCTWGLYSNFQTKTLMACFGKWSSIIMKYKGHVAGLTCVLWIQVNLRSLWEFKWMWCLQQWDENTSSVSFSHSTHLQYYFNTNTSCKVSTVGLHENKERREQLQYHLDSPHTYSLTGGGVSLQQTLISDAILYHCFTICRTSVNVSPMACNLIVSLSILNPLCYTASTMPLLGAVEPDKEAPYGAGLLGLFSGWQAAAQTHS